MRAATEQKTPHGWAQVAVGLVTALATPFLITAIYGLSDASPAWLPFALLGIVAAGVSRRARAVSIGLVIGMILWGGFIAWLLSVWGESQLP